jgi:flagellar assembly protein FliH
MASSDTTSRVHPDDSRIIAADRVVGVQRWTIGGFDGNATTNATAARPQPSQRVAAERLPTVDEVASIEQQARDEGYRTGLAEAREGNERVAALLGGVSESIARMERDMAQAIVKLAVDLARQIVRETITVRPEVIVPVINEALGAIARTAEPGSIHVHPDDMPVVQERLGDALAHGGWKAFPDDNVSRGGCRVEFAGGQVDADVATRWQRVMAQLDRQDAWLA